MKPKRRNPRSEAAMREAIQLVREGKARLLRGAYCYEIRAINCDERWDYDGDIAIFDLRDCYRKRQPLKGITKKLKRALAPKRK